MTTAAALTALLPSCSGIEPGDYVVYRIAATSPKMSSGCFAGGAVPWNLQNDSTTIRTNGLFILYAGQEDDAFFLDIGATTLDGVYEGDADAGDLYAFEGRTVDIDYSCSDGSGDKRTTTVKTTVDMYIDGAATSGEMAATASYGCIGESCGEPIPSCTVTVEFVGTEVEDVELDHNIGTGNADPVPTPSPGVVATDPQPPTGTGGNCEPTCGHGECAIGGPLLETCTACTQTICVTNGHTSCCTTGWDSTCIQYANTYCSMNCPTD